MISFKTSQAGEGGKLHQSFLSQTFVSPPTFQMIILFLPLPRPSSSPTFLFPDLPHPYFLFSLFLCSYYSLTNSCLFLSKGLFCTIAVVVFGIKGDDRDWMPDPEHNFLSWSFALAVVGCFCHWIAGILFWIESRILYKRELKREQQSYSMEPTGIKAWEKSKKKKLSLRNIERE